MHNDRISSFGFSLAHECQEAGNDEALWNYEPKLLLPFRFVASSFHCISLPLP
ncbi:hypothetical protein BS47DRAFT_1353973 [Hydnum rufescens UP504]|uniref:Uncharacterized protein n=1 Tax=Hydnum rufescens UP504 TaxID=1448309 RepID=A0A9P6AGS0_9AGAM|nr:hypothetical protein BS47DRAFT_1353973 [Hydnum rufescens UP504]